MSFLNTYFLWTLVLIAIPIVIHLFHFRRYRKVLFSNISMLESLQSTSQNKRKLRDILLLCCRILSVIFLVLAFAQPFFNKQKPQIQNKVVVFIDNSFSMNMSGEDGNLFDIAKKTSTKLINSYKQSDIFFIASQDFSDNNTNFISQEEALNAIENLNISPLSHNLSDIIENLNKVVKEDKTGNTIYIVSDFQKNISDFENIKTSTNSKYYLCQIPAVEINNLCIDSIWCETPALNLNSNIVINYSISNFGEQNLSDIPFKLFVNNNAVSFGTFNVDAKKNVKGEINYAIRDSGNLNCYMEIVDYPVVFDDKLFFNLDIQNDIQVLLLSDNSPNSFLKKLLENNEAINLTVENVQKFDFSQLDKYNFVIISELDAFSSGLNNEITKYLNNGGACLLIPDKKIDLQSYNLFLQNNFGYKYDSLSDVNTKIDRILLNDKLFEDSFTEIPEQIDLPNVLKEYKIRLSANSVATVLIANQDETAFLTSSPLGNGKFYCLSVNLSEEFSNFQNQALFVVSTLNMILKNATSSRLYFTISDDNVAEIKIKKEILFEKLKLKSLATGSEIIPYCVLRGKSLIVKDFSLVDEAGNYQLLSANEDIAGISYNYDRKESNVAGLDANSISKALKNNNLTNFSILKSSILTSDSISDIRQDSSSELWKIMLLIALFFLISEGILHRL